MYRSARHAFHIWLLLYQNATVSNIESTAGNRSINFGSVTPMSHTATVQSVFGGYCSIETVNSSMTWGNIVLVGTVKPE
jgi:hypothetical protein